jgi:hypothetical protein
MLAHVASKRRVQPSHMHRTQLVWLLLCRSQIACMELDLLERAGSVISDWHATRLTFWTARSS